MFGLLSLQLHCKTYTINYKVRIHSTINLKNGTCANTDNKGKLLVTVFAFCSCSQDSFAAGDKPGPPLLALLARGTRSTARNQICDRG
jgi:hypothetical protein